MPRFCLAAYRYHLLRYTSQRYLFPSNFLPHETVGSLVIAWGRASSPRGVCSLSIRPGRFYLPPLNFILFSSSFLLLYSFFFFQNISGAKREGIKIFSVASTPHNKFKGNRAPTRNRNGYENISLGKKINSSLDFIEDKV